MAGLPDRHRDVRPATRGLLRPQALQRAEQLPPCLALRGRGQRARHCALTLRSRALQQHGFVLGYALHLDARRRVDGAQRVLIARAAMAPRVLGRERAAAERDQLQARGGEKGEDVDPGVRQQHLQFSRPVSARERAWRHPVAGGRAPRGA